MDIDWTVTITAAKKQPETLPTNQQKPRPGEERGEAGEGTSQVVLENAVDPATSQNRPAEQISPAVAQQPNQHLAVGAHQSPLAPELPSLDLENLTTADITSIQTRAQKKRQQQMDAANAIATAASEATPTPLESIPDTPDPEPVDSPVHTVQEVSHSATPTAGAVDRPVPTVEGSQEETTPTLEGNGDQVITTAPFTTQKLIEEQKKDSTLKQMFDAAHDPLKSEFTIKNEILYAINWKPGLQENPLKIVVPRSLRRHVLELGHGCSGHFGSKKTRDHIQQHFYWIGIGKDITDFCKSCKQCANFNSHRQDKQPLMPIPVVHTPWHKIAIDIVGPLNTTTSGYKYILTIIDMATRFPEAIPMKRIDSASTAEALLNVFAIYGIPNQLVHDNGGNFTSQFMKEVMKSLHISQITVSPYHPEANGMIERVNGTIKKALKKAGARDKNWDKWLPFVLHAIRITRHTSTGHSPFELLFGRQPQTPISNLREALEGQHEDVPQPIADYINDLHKTMELAKAAAEATEADAKAKSKAYKDSRTKAKESVLEPGTPVLCFEPNKKKGLSASWTGPYTITKRLGQLTYLIDIGKGQTWRRHRNALKPYTADTVNIATVVMVMSDEEAKDGLTLGLTAQQSEDKPDLDKDIHGPGERTTATSNK